MSLIFTLAVLCLVLFACAESSAGRGSTSVAPGGPLITAAVAGLVR